MLPNSREYICKPSALFSCVCRSDIALFDGIMLVSFVPQVRSILFYDLGCLGLAVGRVLSLLRGQTTHAMPTTWM